jgi:hypothetical protein
MFVRNIAKISILLVILVFFNACDDMDSFFPSAGAYRMNVEVNGISLDECSFVNFNDKVYPYFEESVSDDPDVTALVVFLRNFSGEIVGNKIRYSLDDDAEEDETLVPVKNFDDLPIFPISEYLPVDRYTMVSQVMSGNDVLQKSEKIFYYLGKTVFSYEGINVYLPGVTENPQIIPKETVLLLEAQLDFESRLDPYIVWYSGRRKISEGKFSDGAGQLFWKAPDQSGFFSIRAEVFPINSYIGLAGYQKEVSLLVSSKTSDLNLVSEDITQLVHWYIFEGNLNDSKAPDSEDRSLKPSAKNKLQWKSRNGTYGLAAGSDNTYILPKVSISDYKSANWQALFRFIPLNEGQIFSVMFEDYPDVNLNLNMENKNLVLKLVSPVNTVSQTVMIPEQVSFLTAGINFSILPNLLSAKINIIDNSVEQGELAVQPISIEVEIKDNFQILFGTNSTVEAVNPVYTALWDEFALYNEPPMEIITAEVNRNKHPELDASFPN